MFTTIQQVVEFFEQRYSFGIKPGLTRMNHLLKYVNEPHKKIKAIHITGTNGKGSTIQYIKNALCSNKYTVGQFISPSMEGLTGHIYLNDQPISDVDFIDCLNRLYPAINELDEQNNHPTEFEIMTVLAFDYFTDRVDIALIETGMGGKNDTTNCLQPILSIITNIDKDHTRFLGSEIKAIAYHKAGIIKHQVPVIIGDVGVEAYEVVQAKAIEQQASSLYLGKDFAYTHVKNSEAGQNFVWLDHSTRKKVRIQMNGMHQVKNCSLAIMTLMILEQIGLKICWQASLTGLQKTQVPGRFEMVSKEPVVILDGAHNLAGIRAFLKTIENNYPNARKHLIFSAFEDKDIQSMFGELVHTFSTITLTTFEHPRAARANYLASLLKSDNKYVNNDWQAVISDITQSNEKGTHYFITGSLHFISQVRKYFETYAKNDGINGH